MTGYESLRKEQNKKLHSKQLADKKTYSRLSARKVDVMEKLVYTIEEVAELLSISKSYAYELVRNGTIPVLQLGKKRVIPKGKLHEWINEKTESM